MLRIFFLILLLSAGQANSAAWTQAKGDVQLISNLNFYTSSHYFDENEDVKKSDTNFYKWEINPFIEYGIREDLTIGINPNLQKWIFSQQTPTAFLADLRQCNVAIPAGESKVSALVFEAEIFARKRLWEKGGFVFSVQPLIKMPCLFYNSGQFDLVENTIDYEMRFLSGYGFKWNPDISIGGLKVPFSGQYHFVNLEAAYRKRGKNFSDQLKIDSTIGFRAKPNLLIMGQSFFTKSIGDESVNQEIFGTSLRDDDFYALKLQLSSIRQLSTSTSIQFSSFYDAKGKNSGAGFGSTVSLWYRF